jgi:dipeptidyl aminopeptidase/acylaminoacyl peptidase
VGDVQGNSKMGLVSVETGQVTWIDHGQKDRAVTLSGAAWSEDGANLVVNAASGDNKDFWILLVDQKTGQTKPLYGLHDEAWVMNSTAAWMPDGKSVYFIAEKEGYFQLYTAPVDGSGAKLLTSGKFEVFSPSLSRDKTRFYFTSSEVHPGERHFYSMPLGGGERARVTRMTGNHRVVLSPDEKTAAVIYSCSNKPPELYLMENAPGEEARQITTSPTAEWLSFPWLDPRLITFKARDGAEVYARVYTPEMLDAALGRKAAAAAPARRGRAAAAAPKPPAVIFVHGAGYAQNVHKYWSSYYREYMFHHILADRGFVVMDIDYRGSSGYGRDWRTGIFRHMGGKDLDDQVDGARWMVENLDVDPARIGIYGGSYGGFITLMALFTQPDVFAAGASLRPVTDWAHYNHSYTSDILNQPQGDIEAYRRSSPIYFAEGLKGALLICHGVVDTNVHFQDTVRLAERLIELRKENWEVALFPVENHGFTRADSWADEYRRILKLFEDNLSRK